MDKFRVLVTDPLSADGLEILGQTPGLEVRSTLAPTAERLETELKTADAWLVRSETKITRDWIAKAPRLKLIGRAGVGTDNIDVQAATENGIAVVNAPAANTTAACEHAFGLLLALARNIPQADADVKAGRWRRSSWIGLELEGKILGIVGLGRIGREMAKRASAFGMKPVAYDPFVSSEQAEKLGVGLLGLKDLLSQSDCVTLHAPASEKARHILNRETLAWMKPQALLVNCARGELIDESALSDALTAGRLGGAALDVFEKEPLSPENSLRRCPNVILTPHLGASTREAQSKVAYELARSVLLFKEKGVAPNAINLPGFDADTLKSLGEFLDLAETLGRFLGQTIDAGLRELCVSLRGDFKPSQRAPLAVAALKGLLSTLLAQGVTYVSAPTLARERGIRLSEAVDPPSQEGYRQLVTVAAATDRGSFTVSGALISPGEPRIVRLGDLSVEVRPRGKMLVLTNEDIPGVIGRVGILLGENGVNIADMRVGRRSPHGEAAMVLTVDDEVPLEVRQKLSAVSGVTRVRWVKL